MALLGSNVTFAWKFRTAPPDKERMSGVIFGKWSREGNFTELKGLCGENETEVARNNNTRWQCTSSGYDGVFAASFRLLNVTMRDNAMYGCRLLFGRHRTSITESAQLLVGGKDALREQNWARIAQGLRKETHMTWHTKLVIKLCYLHKLLN